MSDYVSAPEDDDECILVSPREYVDEGISVSTRVDDDDGI